MLNEFIKQAIEDHNFIKIGNEEQSDEISFFKMEKGELRRYKILIEQMNLKKQHP